MKRYVFSEGKIDELYQLLDSRSPVEQTEVLERVQEIMANVRQKGDAALRAYSKQFDRVESMQSIEVPASYIESSYLDLSEELRRTMEQAAKNIRSFHERQKQNSWFEATEEGVMLGQKVTALARVGLYAPAGSAPLPSTVLMNAIPAKVAGVGEIILCSPPDSNGLVNPLIAAAARIAGVDRVFAIGGAQAVAAMAYGTESVPRVDKIAGPGNIYVTMAKKQVFGVCGIDMTAGPSEVLILADEMANPAFIAADLLSQAEHDPMASSILVTSSAELADSVQNELVRQLELLSRSEIARKSLDSFGAIVIVRNLDEGLEVSNRIAPEHLELVTAEPMSLLGGIKNAGAIFMGAWSPEPLGDYFAGPNHTLPTAGTSRFFSPLSVDDFVKKSSLISYSKKAFANAAQDVVRFAEAEGLDAHAAAVKIRIDEA